MPLTCARCGTDNPDEAKFCLECGNALAAPDSRAAREERKTVSVLFADLVGFTSQAERMDPEEVRALLQPYHQSLRADLERWGGTVEKFIGDAVMALFGAPVAREDDPERAVRAALAIRDTVTADERLHVRIGIATGEALVALEARPQSGEGMASGDVVNTAARLEVAAPVDGILVDEATWRATSRVIEYREHAPVTAKGKSEPVAVHEVVTARSRFGVDVRATGGAPLVGRGRELDLLVGAFARAQSEREPQLVTIVGVPGIGKSRLVWELFHHIDTGNVLVRWRQGRALPFAEGVSFWALGEIVKAEAGILETDSAAEAGAKLAQAVASVVREDGSTVESAEPGPAEPSRSASTDVSWLERHLRPLVGLETGSELRGDHRGEAFSAWTRYLEALADERPLVVVFEDLQWADDGLLDFIDHLADWASGVPLLVLGTARPELLSRRPGWGGGKSNALTISLAPLSDGETGTLVAALVEQAIIPNAMRQAVLDRAQGNPLYAEEFARLYAEGGRAEELPESVQGIVSARLDTLDRAEKELLQDAAVAGKVFWSGTLVHMRDRSRVDVEERLHGLERKEFVRRDRRSSVAGETEFAFRHILVRDVAYGQIPRGERAERHALAARWIESLGRSADHAELLANHYLAAIELARVAGRPTDPYAGPALASLGEAGARAITLNAFAGAARYDRAALGLMTPDDPRRPAFLLRLGKALLISEVGGSVELAEAEAGLRAAGDVARAAEAAVLQAELAWHAGDRERTNDHLARAAKLAEGVAASFSKAYVLSDLARYHMLAGRNGQAIALGRQALAIAEELGLDEVRAHALDNIGAARVNSGDPAGIADLETAIAVARAVGSPEETRAMNNLSVALWHIGEMRRAWALRRDALDRARQHGNTSLVRFIESVIPEAHYEEGEWDTALQKLDEAVAEAEAAGGHVLEGGARGYRARILFARAGRDAAEGDLRRGLEAARRIADPQVLVPVLAFAAWVALRSSRRADANELLDELMRQEGVGDPVLEASIVLLELERRADLRRYAAQFPAGRWRDLFGLVSRGRLADAAVLMGEMGSPADSALLHFVAAERLAGEGRLEGAREELDRAVAFWRSVGASHYLAMADTLAARLTAESTAAGSKRPAKRALNRSTRAR